MTETMDFVKKSVTQNDFTQVTDTGGVLRIVVPFWNLGEGRVILPPDPPEYYSQGRDVIMRATVHNEAMWGAAIGIAITKMVSLAFEVKSAVDLRARRGQELLLQADGIQTGWVGFLSKQLRDFLTTDNGSFYEIVRATSAAGSRILGLRHLDSLRCTRTGDPERPVVFRDRRGYQHVLRDYQVVMLSDMPDPSETFYGVGLCAAARAYHAIYKLSKIEWYLREKVGGLHPLAIHIVNGMLTRQIEDAVKAVEEGQIARGAASYMGAVIIGTPKENPPELVTIPLAELPDRFQRKEEFDISLLTYADCLGLDPQDLQPLSGQPLGTGAQSQVLDDKQKGKGLSAWRQGFTHGLNNFVLDELSTFSFVEKDYRDQERQAAVQKARADVAGTRIDKKITTPAQELQILVDANDLPREFLEKDMLPGDTVSDTDKPEADDAAKVGSAAEKPQEAPAEGAAGGAPEKPATTPAAERLTAAQQQQNIARDQQDQKRAEMFQAQAAGKPAAAKKPQEGEEETKPAPKQGEEDAKKKKERYTGAMVALFVPPIVAQQMAIDAPGALPAGDLHITLAYLGDTATETMDRTAVDTVVQSLAAETAPIGGMINGQGFFQVPASGDQEPTCAHFATFDAPALPAFRQKLVEALAHAGIPVVQNHGFTPHITIAYQSAKTIPQVSLPPGEIAFPRLTVAWGDERRDFNFMNERTKASERAQAEADRLLMDLLETLAKKRG